MRLKKRIIFILILIFAVSLFFAIKYKHVFIINKGIYFFNRGEYAKSVVKLEPLREKHYDNYDLIKYLSTSLFELRKFDKAEEIIQKFVHKNPKIPKGKFLLGQYYFKRGEIKKSSSAFLEYLNKQNINWRKYEDLFAFSVINLSEGNYLTIQNFIEKSAKRFEENEDILVFKGFCCDVMGFYDEAEKYYHKAIQIGCENPLMFFRYGLILLAKNSFEQGAYYLDLSRFFGFNIMEKLHEAESDFTKMQAFFIHSSDFLKENNIYANQESDINKNVLNIFLNEDLTSSSSQLKQDKQTDLERTQSSFDYIIKPKLKKGHQTGVIEKNDQVIFFRNSEADIDLYVKERGFYLLKLEYRGTHSGRIFPWCSIKINSLHLKKCYMRSLNPDFINLYIYLTEGLNTLTINYINDTNYLNPAEDRNLFIGTIYLSKV